MSDSIIRGFREAQFGRGMALAARSRRIRLEPLMGAPPATYMLHLDCHGLVQSAAGEVEVHDRWAMGLRIPDNYLRAQVHVAEVVTLLGPRHAFHPNLRHPFVCMTIHPGMPLDELIYALYDLVTWNVFGVGDDGLQPAAAQWARHQPPGRFPIDRRPLVAPAGQAHPNETRR